jgi:phosphoglycerate dehydrogenase-like enzyme
VHAGAHSFSAFALRRLPNLKLLVTTGMRNLAIDIAAANELGVVVCGTPGLGIQAAEMAWALILACARHVPSEDRAIREGRWQTSIGDDMAGRTLGIMGLGKLGERVAKVGLAFEMDVLAWSQNLMQSRCDEVGVRLAASKDELLRAADYVTLHVVLSERTRGLIGERELSLMKPGAYLVNTARGPIVDEGALVRALQERRIAGGGAGRVR